MRIIQNGYNQTSSCQYNHKFFICTHINHPFHKTRSRWETPSQLPG
nr:MAG TPA: hypothetical protein [Caudoviricetes sp.]